MKTKKSKNNYNIFCSNSKCEIKNNKNWIRDGGCYFCSEKCMTEYWEYLGSGQEYECGGNTY